MIIATAPVSSSRKINYTAPDNAAIWLNRITIRILRHGGEVFVHRPVEKCWSGMD